jgi:hypothetical protein
MNFFQFCNVKQVTGPAGCFFAFNKVVNEETAPKNYSGVPILGDVIILALLIITEVFIKRISI